MDPLLDFTGKVVLITGAASGFGALLAESFDARGARLVLGDIDEDGLGDIAAQLRGDVLTMGCDVTVEADCAALVDAAVEMYGGLDIAINNAGGCSQMVATTEVSEEFLDQQFALNAKSVLFGMKYQIPVMQERGGGAIINVSSMAGLGGAPKLSAYGAAKHAVVGMTKTAAVEYARDNIRINAVCPFFALTPLVTDSDFNDMTGFLAQGSPMKRLGEPGEITDVILMLSSPANTYMTGQAIAIDGGVSAY